MGNAAACGCAEKRTRPAGGASSDRVDVGEGGQGSKINVTQLALIWDSHDPSGAGQVPNAQVLMLMMDVQQLVFKEMLRQKAALESMVSEAMLTSDHELALSRLLLKELSSNLVKVERTLTGETSESMAAQFVAASPAHITKQEFLGQAKRILFRKIVRAIRPHEHRTQTEDAIADHGYLVPDAVEEDEGRAPSEAHV